MLAVIHTIPTAQRQVSQTLICLPARNESVWWVSDLWVTEHTLQIQFNPWLLVLLRTWESMLLKFNTWSFLLPPMQGQRYGYMTPSMACAAGGDSGKSNQGMKGETRQHIKQRQFYAWRQSLPHLQDFAKHQSKSLKALHRPPTQLSMDFLSCDISLLFNKTEFIHFYKDAAMCLGKIN